MITVKNWILQTFHQLKTPPSPPASIYISLHQQAFRDILLERS